jgi:hypothetical protein
MAPAPLKARPGKPAPKPRKPAAPRSGVMGASLLAGVCALVVFAPQIAALVGRPSSEVYESAGYNKLIDDLIGKLGWLRVDYSDPDRPRVALSRLAPRGGDTDDRPLLRFRRYSYLGQDMQHADENVWMFDSTGEHVVGIQPAAHRLARPFADQSEWTGDLEFRGGDAQALALRSRSGLSLNFVGASSSEGRRQAPVSLRPLESDAPPAQKFDLTLRERTVASVFLVGGTVFVRSYPSGDVKLRVGDWIAPQRDGPPVLKALEPGQTLSISAPGVAAAFDLERGASAISHYEPGRPRSRFPGLDSLARGVESAMGRTPANVRTTLDRDLQLAAQTALVRKAEELRDQGPAFPASATLMDASNGEILALATYPSARSHLDARGARSVRTDPMLERNQSFVRLPVGSVAKVPFSLAILQSDPSLAELYVRPATEDVDDNGKAVKRFRTLLGVDLGAFIDDHAPPGGAKPGMIDFNTFLSHSSNKYAAALMLLAMAPPGGHPDRAGSSEPYAIGAKDHHGPPDLEMLNGARSGDYGLVPRPNGAVNLPWTLNLRSDFDLNAEGDGSGKDDAYNHAIWGPFAGAGYDAVSPEKEAFGLGSIHALASDYVMTILGGGRSRWTTVKVAEVFSRVVTRRAVQASILQAPIGGRPGVVAPQPLNIDDRVWKPVILGMMNVAKPGGTGASLQDSIPTVEGSVVRVFAKTGTPTVEQFTGRKPPNRALQDYIDEGCELDWDAGRSRLSVGASLSDACRDTADAPDVRREIARLNRVLAGRPAPRGLRLFGARVTGVPIDPEEKPLFAHAVALVVARYKDDQAPADQPIRALTIVINIQKRPDVDKLPALEVARTLLKDPAVRAWLGNDPAPQVKGKRS